MCGVRSQCGVHLLAPLSPTGQPWSGQPAGRTRSDASCPLAGAWWTYHFLCGSSALTGLADEPRTARNKNENSVSGDRSCSPQPGACGARNHSRVVPESRVWYAAPEWLPAWAALVEPACKTALPLLGVLDESPWSPLFGPDGLIIHESIHGLQHTLMYLSIVLSGMADLAYLRYGEALPAGLDGLALLAGFAMQAFILVFHLGSVALDQRLHLLLVMASANVAISTGAALRWPRSAAAGFVRCVAILTLGSFYIQVGDLMFCRPAFDSVEGTALAPTIFLLHGLGWSVLLFGAQLLLLRARGAGKVSHSRARTMAVDDGKPLPFVAVHTTRHDRLDDA